MSFLLVLCEVRCSDHLVALRAPVIVVEIMIRIASELLCLLVLSSLTKIIQNNFHRVNSNVTRGKLYYTRHHQSNICTHKLFYCKVEGGGIICNTPPNAPTLYMIITDCKDYLSVLRSW